MSLPRWSDFENDAVEVEITNDEEGVHFLTPEEAWESFDAAARRYLGMSGEAFIAAWDAGKFDDNPDQPALILVSMLRPVGR